MKEIYLFMNGRDVSASFSDPKHKSKYSFKQILAVNTEAKRVVALIKSLGKDEDTTSLTQAKSTVITELDKSLMFTNELSGKTWVQYQNSLVIEE